MKQNSFLCTIVLLLSFLGKTATLDAQSRVSLSEAVRMAKSVVQTRDYDNMTFYSQQNGYGDTVLYQIVLDGNQSVIVSGCKKTKAILAMIDNMPESVFTEENMPEGLQYFINKYSSMVSEAIRDTLSLRTQHAEWEVLDGPYNELEGRGNRLIVGPMLATSWGQQRPNVGNNTVCAYNYYVQDTHDDCECSEKKCVTGCTPVAMGQIMNYWKYPVYMPEDWQFDWCNMANALNAGSVNYVEERDAVAWLLWQCGLSSNTHYNSIGCNAFAWPSAARDGLVDDYGYSSDADRKLRSSYSTARWKDMLIGNMQNGWPVLYAAVNDSMEGHSFVCDGYNSTTECFHFNFGHRGICDGWCTIDSIWEGDSHWNSLERAVFNIHPSSTIDYCNFTLPLWLHYQTYYMQHSSPQPYYVVPTTTTHLISVPEEYQANWRTIPAGVTTSYEAHVSVTLVPGFHAEHGSEFTVSIDPCPSCESAQQSKSTHNKKEDWAEAEAHGAGYRPVASDNEVKLKVYPNPTDGLLTVEYNLEEDSHVGVSVYAMSGVERQTLSEGKRPKGFNQEKYDVSKLQDGVYVVCVSINGEVITNKVIKR